MSSILGEATSFLAHGSPGATRLPGSSEHQQSSRRAVSRPPAAGAQQNRGTPPCPSLPRHAVEGRAEFREPCLSGSGSVQHLPGKMGKLADKASDGLALWGIFINKPSSLSPTTSAPGTGMTAPPRAGGGKPAKVGTAVRASPPARRL